VRFMTIWQLWPIVSAVVLGNAVSFFFFMAAMKCSKLQKDGAKDDELPIWVYAGLICAPVVIGIGIHLLD
jgi:hypothetical protein